ncbi:MAG: hypothetical protein NC081_00360 [Roseburia sp.]|nr:hypothetical protein [Roseburia sp.]
MFPVQEVSRVSRTRREGGNSQQHHSAEAKADGFAVILDKALDESRPVDCYTVTYNARSQLQTYYYRHSREYTY